MAIINLTKETFKQQISEVDKPDIDDAAEIAEEYGVDTIPTLIIFKNGEVLGSIVAPDSKAKIEAFIEENL